MKSNTIKKFFIYGSGLLVLTSIVLASYFDKDNTLRDEAIKMGDSYYCEKIETTFIKEKCFKIIKQKQALLKKCQEKHGNLSRECNNLAY